MDIRSLNVQEISSYIDRLEQPTYRAEQIYQWIWQKGVRSFDQMTNLPISLRNDLSSYFILNNIVLASTSISRDKTIKYGIRLHDGLVVEAVLIPQGKRVTACVSSQVGCSLDCTFCATAKLKRIRNLSVQEIYDQVFHLRQESFDKYNTPLTNIVFMGMGEPLMNFKNVVDGIQMITSSQGLSMSAERITVSTSGISKLIRKLAETKLGVRLAVSLHSARNEVRETIMPFSKKFKLVELQNALIYWYQKTKSKITFEYIILKGINDTEEDIKCLVEYCKRVPSKVNFIEYNPVEGDNFKPATPEVLQLYMKELKLNNVHSTVRKSRGKDIDAACGQLANKLISATT